MTFPQTQRALVITELGKPLTLVTDRPVPQPGPGQVQIKVRIAGPNPHDQLARDVGLYVEEILPAVVTNDVVGVITALGENVTGFSTGDIILGQANFEKGSPQSGLQEYAVLDADFSAKIPTTISGDEAASLPTNSTTGVIALFHENNLSLPAPWTPEAASFNYPNQAILIIGGGTSCGKFGVQLASLAGFGTIVVVGGPEADLKSLGATHVLDRHLQYETLLEQIRAIVGDDLLYAYDTANPPEGQILAINALSCIHRGKFARLLPIGPVDESQVAAKENGYDMFDLFGSAHAHPELSREYFKRLPSLLLDGKIKPGRFVVVEENGLDPDKVNTLLDKYRDYAPVVKTHFHL